MYLGDEILDMSRSLILPPGKGGFDITVDFH
jgi:hypothetical protein